MKKKIAVIFLFLIFALAIEAGAETSSDSASQADANATINYSPRTNSTINESPNLLMPIKQDGSLVTAPQTFLKTTEINDDILPEFYKKMGWAILKGAPFNKTKIKRVKNERKGWLSETVTDTGEDAIEKAQNDEDVIVGLDYWPKDAEETNSARVAMEKEKNILTQSLSEALYWAWYPKKAKNVLILYNTKYVSQADVFALGTAFVTGAAIGPKSDANNPVAGIAGGSGWGNAKSSVYKEPIFWVIAFSKQGDGPLPELLPKKAEKIAFSPQSSPPIQPITINITSPSPLTVGKETRPEEKASELEKNPKIEVIKLPAIYFDTDTSKVADTLKESNVSGQFANLQIIADWVVKFFKDNPESKEKIWLIGSADERYTNDHNLKLGLARAMSVGEEIKALAEIAGISSQTIKDRLIPASVGEEHAVSKLLEKNRSVYLLKAEVLSDI
jgi:outer membrane protein OmpA-like peptidoglycan-associated protein